MDGSRTDPPFEKGYLIERPERIWAYGSDVYDLTVGAGEEVILVVAGDGDTDLDLFVYDHAENLVDFDAGERDPCVCRFHTAEPAVYRVEVHNVGSIFNDYRLSVLRMRQEPDARK